MKIEFIYSLNGGWFNIYPESAAEAQVLKAMETKIFKFNSCSYRDGSPFPYCRGLGPVDIEPTATTAADKKLDI